MRFKNGGPCRIGYSLLWVGKLGHQPSHPFTTVLEKEGQPLTVQFLPIVSCELLHRQHHLENKNPGTEVMSYVLLG